jgi:hypothetical protein
MNIVSGSTNNTFYTRAVNFDDRIVIDPETGYSNLMTNGDAEFGSTYNINSAGVSRTGSYEGSYCFYDIGNRGYLGSVYIPVNTSDTYLLSYYAKSVGTVQSQMYAGLQCFDEDLNFIDLRNNGDSGNTTLASPLNNGDTTITLTDASGWQATGAQYYFKNILFFPASHPKYYTPWGYTRYGFGNPTIPDLYYGTRTGNTLYLSTDGVNNNLTWSYGSLPAGTPVSNGLAGGTYGYYLNCNTTIPNTWTKYSLTLTGEGKSSGCGYNVFRYGTKYVTWMALANYGQSSTSIVYYDNIVFANMTNRSQTYAYNKHMSRAKLGTLNAYNFNELGIV